MAGLYIHIPFCRSRCIYCGFYSTTALALRGRYAGALCREMELRRDYLPEGCRIETIYLGGGTPSQLDGEHLRSLFLYIYKVYDVSPDAEITIECNPDDITDGYSALIRSLGVNRVSMGVQTFDDERLRFIHRRHTSGQAASAVQTLRANGIGNISVDLMFGFPGETLGDWRHDIAGALRLEPQHISAYSLAFEEGTPLHRMLEEGTVEEADEDLSAGMYDVLADSLTGAGYEHYEISNFARPGFRSRHNGSYWTGTPYIGIGAAAHSFDTRSRQWNVSDIGLYMEGVERGDVPFEREELDTATRYDDAVTTALRTCEGISLERVREDFGSVFHGHILDCARRHIDGGMLEIKSGRLRLTRKGLFVSDGIMSDLMFVQ